MGNVLLSDKNTFSFIAPENGALRHSPKDCGEAKQKFFVKLLYTKVCGGTGAMPL